VTLSDIEIVTLTLSLILGLSMAQMLNSVALAIRARQDSSLHWLPLCWTTSIFLLHVQFFLAVFGIDEFVPSWTWSWFGPILLLALLLFLGGALILPARDREWASGLLYDFEVHGRLALIPVSLYLILWMPLNVRIGFGWISPSNVFDVALVLLAAVTFVSRGTRIRSWATIVYLFVTAWGMFGVWSPGGAS